MKMKESAIKGCLKHSDLVKECHSRFKNVIVFVNPYNCECVLYSTDMNAELY